MLALNGGLTSESVSFWLFLQKNHYPQLNVKELTIVIWYNFEKMTKVKIFLRLCHLYQDCFKDFSLAHS